MYFEIFLDGLIAKNLLPGGKSGKSAAEYL